MAIFQYNTSLVTSKENPSPQVCTYGHKPWPANYRVIFRYMAPRARGADPLGIGCLCQGIRGGVSRLSPRLVSTTYSDASSFIVTFFDWRWFRPLAYAVISFYFSGAAFWCCAISRLRWFRIVIVLASRLVLGLLLCGGFVFVSSYSGVSYGDRSSKLTTF